MAGKGIALSVIAWLMLAAGPAWAHAFELEEVRAFDPTAGELPESIAADDDGNLYLSMSNTIRRIAPNGTMTTWGVLPIPVFALGVKVGHDGCVYTVSTSLSEVPGAFVWRICSAGAVEQFAALDQSGGPNDLAFDDDGDLYVTDPTLGRIWKVTPEGQASVWLAHPLLLGNPADPALQIFPIGVDGIAFDRHKQNLYVGNLDYGRIIRIKLVNGAPGAVSVFVEDPLLEGADGLAFDKKGTLYVAVNAADRLVSIDPCGDITVLAEGGLLDGPSSFAFGTRGNDKHTLYVTSLAFSRAFGVKPGTPRPALLRARVTHKGLTLP